MAAYEAELDGEEQAGVSPWALQVDFTDGFTRAKRPGFRFTVSRRFLYVSELPNLFLNYLLLFPEFSSFLFH